MIFISLIDRFDLSFLTDVKDVTNKMDFLIKEYAEIQLRRKT